MLLLTWVHRTGRRTFRSGRRARLFTSVARSQTEDLKSFYTARLQECIGSRNLGQAKLLHLQIVENGLIRDRFFANLTIHMYGRCGDITSARSVFDAIPRRNRVSWSIMIGAYAQTGHSSEALELFKRMGREGIKPSNVTFVSLISACSDLGPAGLQEGRAIHGKITDFGLDSDPILCNNLVNMYGKCGSLKDARRVFEGFRDRDVIAWTAMIAAYAQAGHNEEAVELFWEMVRREEDKPNKVTFITVLGACANAQDLEDGREIHAFISHNGSEEEDVLVATALLNMYGKCGSPEEAKLVFERMAERDVIAWNAIIAAYAQQGQGKEALELLWRMDLEGVRPTQVTFISVLDGCSSFGGLAEGRGVHRRILASCRSVSSTALGNTLINMYGKSGSLNEASVVFEWMGRLRDGVSWAALIAAYAHHGHSGRAREIFERMELEGVQPTGVTFISILAACSHAGLLMESKRYFKAMSGDHGIQPTIEHFGCLIDLFGRLGRLEEVKDLIANMPFQPGCLEWRIVLGACRTQFDLESVSDAAEVASFLEPGHPAAYVILSGLYCSEKVADKSADFRAYGF